MLLKVYIISMAKVRGGKTSRPGYTHHANKIAETSKTKNADVSPVVNDESLQSQLLTSYKRRKLRNFYLIKCFKQWMQYNQK